MANYESNSPWYKTPINANYLEIYSKRTIPAANDDITYEIEPQYSYRPDLLAYDLYGSSKPWWVFSVRNMESLKDPIFDFIPGLKIKLPQKSIIDSVLGK